MTWQEEYASPLESGVTDTGYITYDPADEPTPAHAHLKPGAECPTCHQRVRPKKEKSEEKRQRATWSISIPKDNRENGADVLDSLLDACARDPRIKALGYEEGTPKYFLLVPILADWLEGRQHVAA